MTRDWIKWDACPLCSGSGCRQHDYGLEQCPNCRLHQRWVEQDRIRAAAEDRVDAEAKAVRV